MHCYSRVHDNIRRHSPLRPLADICGVETTNDRLNVIGHAVHNSLTVRHLRPFRPSTHGIGHNESAVHRMIQALHPSPIIDIILAEGVVAILAQTGRYALTLLIEYISVERVT